MDKYSKESSELPAEIAEIEKNFPLGNFFNSKATETALKMKQPEKSRVMRLHDKEVQLINFIRDITSDKLLLELKNALNMNNQSSKIDYPNLKNLMSILQNRRIFDFDTFVDNEFLSKEEADYLIKCVRENKNIIITGRSNVGKTTFLNSLLKYQKNSKLMIFEYVKNLILDDEILRNNSIITHESKNISALDIGILSNTENSKLILGDIRNFNDALGLLFALETGISVSATFLSGKDWRYNFVNLFEKDNMKKHAKEILNKSKIVQVNISMNKDYKRLINKIEEK